MSMRFVLAFASVLLLAACSTPTQRVERLAESEYDPSSSFARNVMMASGRGLIRDDDGPGAGRFSARQDGGSVSTIGAGVLTGNPGLGVGLGLLRGLTGPGYNQGTSNMVIAWMPAEMAVDGIDARNNLNDNVRNSLTIAFEKKNIPYSTIDYGLDLLPLQNPQAGRVSAVDGLAAGA
ncbi:MAG: hypothetical protein EA405_01780 [Rhodospirillales bacterium]|nr:MAG: hypothetical protein EA405_01780 [Rhodospirillales bacterium]